MSTRGWLSAMPRAVEPVAPGVWLCGYDGPDGRPCKHKSRRGTMMCRRARLMAEATLLERIAREAKENKR